MNSPGVVYICTYVRTYVPGLPVVGFYICVRSGKDRTSPSVHIVCAQYVQYVALYVGQGFVGSLPQSRCIVSHYNNIITV